MRLSALLAALLIFDVATAVACECATLRAKSAFKRASAVFLGEIVAQEQYGPTTYRIIERFKGPETATLRVDGREGLCSYGPYQSVGSHHVIFAYGPPDALQTSLCSRNSPALDAKSDLAILRRRGAWWRSPLSSVRIVLWFERLRWKIHRSI